MTVKWCAPASINGCPVYKYQLFRDTGANDAITVQEGGDIEPLNDSKVQILREYCKLVDKNIIASTKNEIDQQTFMDNCLANANQLTEWIANVGGVAKSAISLSGSGFKKVDN